MPDMEEDEVMVVKDSNGNILSEGDSVTTTKDLDVKGSHLKIKRGTKIKNIRFTDDDELIECSVDGTRGIMLKTCFLKKA
jgi:protein PhnA